MIIKTPNPPTGIRITAPIVGAVPQSFGSFPAYAPSALIGTLSTIDDDPTVDNFSYRYILQSAGDFNITLNSPGNYSLFVTAPKSYWNVIREFPISITTVGASGLSFLDILTVTTAFVNSPPHDVTLTLQVGGPLRKLLSATSIQFGENEDIASTLATFTAQDLDVQNGDQSVVCALVSSGGGTFDMGPNGNLRLLQALSFEDHPVINFSVQCVDNYGSLSSSGQSALSEIKVFSVIVVDEPSPPKDLALVQSASLAENDQKTDFYIGDVMAIDGDTIPSGTLNTDMLFAVQDISQTDRHKFVVKQVTCTPRPKSGLSCTGKLFLNGMLNYEESASLGITSVQIRVTDYTSRSQVMTVNIRCTNMNDPVTGFKIFKIPDLFIREYITSFPEKPAAGAVIGGVEVLDEDIGQQYTFSLPQNDLQAFFLSASDVAPSLLQVQTPTVFVFEINPTLSYMLRITENRQDGVPGTLGVTTYPGKLVITDRPRLLSASKVQLSDDLEVGDTSIVIQLLDFDSAGTSVSFSILFPTGPTLLGVGTPIVDSETKFVNGIRLVVLKTLGGLPNITFSITATFAANGARRDVPPPVSTVFTLPVIAKSNFKFKSDPVFNIAYQDGLEDQVKQQIIPAYVTESLHTALMTKQQVTLNLEYSVDPVQCPVINCAYEIDNAIASTPRLRLSKRAVVNIVRNETLRIIVRDKVTSAAQGVTIQLFYFGYCSIKNPCSSGYKCIDLTTLTSDNPVNYWVCNCKATVCAAPGNLFYPSGLYCDGPLVVPCTPVVEKSAAASSLAGGIVAVIAIGVIFLVVLVSLVLVVFFKNKRKMDQSVLHLTASGEEAINAGFVPKITQGGFEAGVANPMYDWYRPSMTRQASSDHLEPLAEGAFVVRDSAATPGWHMMVLKHENTILHEKIMLNNDGEYELLPSKSNRKQPAFATLPELVEYYKQERDESPYILCGGGDSNPIYDNHCLGASRKGEAKPGYVLTDPNAPQLPLKRKDYEQVLILSSGSEDMYTNATEAKQALASHKADYTHPAYRTQQHSSAGTHVDSLKSDLDERSGYMAVQGANSGLKSDLDELPGYMAVRGANAGLKSDLDESSGYMVVRGANAGL